ncbi:uncharacterized protein LOC122799682 [Protopterus annectens]|uniref:uncharacterized protein LOC122799682 n=1 Tax=Protopterus annectens TaxID=7888 RepID=UPI001CFAA145|nr:uncharacterized protein LOC122799682 [Protopterus annectens]
MTSVGSPLRLPECTIGPRKFRVIHISTPHAFELSSSCKELGSLIPLFLGADVIAHTGIRTENHPKFHAKFAKKGLATKLVFGSEFRFEGLRLPSGINSLWFYSIQGLFRVAFETYNKKEQLAVLDHLQALWKARINDDLLNQVYEMNMLLDASKTEEVVEHQHWCHLWKTELSGNIPSTSSSYSDLTAKGKALHKNDVSVDLEVCSDCNNRGSDAEHNYCIALDSVTTDSSTIGTGHVTEDQISQKIESLHKMLNFQTAQMHGISESAVLLTLDMVELVINGIQSVNCAANLIKEFLNNLYELTVKEDNADKAGNFIYNNWLLYTISGWLGDKFCSANLSISRQVEEFKRSHIDHITDLPPAEVLVSSLFPEAMKILLLNWMGLNNDLDIWKRHSEYPILLLILEFANHNLITGVAHVLYSSLIQK